MGARNQHKAGGANEFHIHRAYIIYASIFVRVVVHDTVKVTARLQYFHICSCNGS